MSQFNRIRVLAAGLLLACTASLPLCAYSATLSTAPDANLFTNYSRSSGTGNVMVYWTVCGSTQQSGGCYDSGSIGPFVDVGAMLESDPVVSGNVVTRNIYVLDPADPTGVKLYVYKKTDTVTPSFDTATVVLTNKLSLPQLVGGASVRSFMAANSSNLYIGTSQSTQAVVVNKSSLASSAFGGFSPPENLTAITANSYGDVTLTWTGGFYTIAPYGIDGGGSEFMLDTVQGIVPPVPGVAAAMSPLQRGFHMKAPAQYMGK